MNANRAGESTQKTSPAKEGGKPEAGQAPAARRVAPAAARQSRMGQAFSQIVAVLMRDPNFRNMRIADLEWLVLPPVMAGQFRLAHAQTGGARPGAPMMPVAVALWARVSPALEKGLSENLDKQVRLRPADWATGDKVWLMAAAGDPRAIPTFLKQLNETEFKGQSVKLRARGQNGKVQIRTLDQHVDALAQQIAKAQQTAKAAPASKAKN